MSALRVSAPANGSALAPSQDAAAAFGCALATPSELNYFAMYMSTYYYTLLMLMGDDVDPTTAPAGPKGFMEFSAVRRR